MELDNLGSIATGAVDSISSTVYPILWSAIGLVLVLLVVWFLQHKHIISYRLLSNSGASRPYRDRAKEIKVDGVTFWKLLKKRIIIPVPPAEALEDIGRGNKPKYYAEMIWSEEHGLIPLTYDINTHNVIQKTRVVGNRGQVVEGVHMPFTPQQRSLLIGQIRKAEARKTKDVWDRITQLAVPLMLVMLFLAVLLFWEDIAKPSKDMAASASKMQQENQKITRNLADVTAQIARITNELTGSDIPIEQTISEEENG